MQTKQEINKLVTSYKSTLDGENKKHSTALTVHMMNPEVPTFNKTKAKIKAQSLWSRVGSVEFLSKEN